MNQLSFGFEVYVMVMSSILLHLSLSRLYFVVPPDESVNDLAFSVGKRDSITILNTMTKVGVWNAISLHRRLSRPNFAVSQMIVSTILQFFLGTRVKKRLCEVL